jgi:replicative DNA helicase
VPGISSGIAPLDNLTDGWMTPRLIVLAARPGFGKTATGLWCADMAGQSEVETVFVSVEQPTKQLQKRRLAMRTGIDLRGVRNRERYAQVLPDLMAETAKMRHEPLTFVQGPRSVRAIRLELQRMIAKGRHPKVVVIDYLTKLRSDRKAERHDLAVGDITGDLCRMAIDLECTILLLAQLNRESVKDGKVRRPTVSDLRDSGIIEQDADQILLLWPGAPSDDDIPMAPGSGVVPFEMLLDKNRHGPKGSVRLNWWEATGRFEVPTYLPRIARYG